MNPPTNFNARSDSAALALKAQLSKETGREIKPRSVPVGPNGQPAPPLPPEGSYARQQIERQRAAIAQARAAQPQTAEDLAPPQEPQADPASQVHQQQPDQGQLSSNAQQRFSQLTQQLRERERQLQAAEARSRELEESQAQTNARLQAVEARFNSVVNQNLDSLDPETRQQVLMQAAADESAARIEQRVMSKMAPLVERVTTQAIEAELNAVSNKYPAFAIDVHGPLIESFRRQNPNCTIEQAFRAVAEPDELVVGRQRAAAVPPIAVPHVGNNSPRYVPQPDPQRKTAEQELDEDRQRAFNLARSTDPNDRRAAGIAMDRYIANKLGNRLPGRR